MTTKWWGWGESSKSYPLENHKGFLSFLQDKLQCSGEITQQPKDLDSLEIPATKAGEAFVKTLVGIFGQENVHSDGRDRFLHGFGKGYLDLIEAWKGRSHHLPDVVLYPTKDSQIAQLFSESANWDFVVVPYGGATSVVGGVSSRISEGKIVICLDFRLMNRIVGIDEKSLLAEVQPGCIGPDLERALNSVGLTAGHFPQSFEYSSVGGWVATRGAGYESTRYGKIENIVESVRLVTPQGTIETPRVPASAAGPDIREMVLGSEGSMGVITAVTLRLRKAPASTSYVGVLFRDFEDGIEAVRTMVQSDIVPNVVRLSNPNETAASLALARRDSAPLIERVGTWFLKKRGYLDSKGSLLILGFEGSHEWVRFEQKRAIAGCKQFHGFPLGQRVGRAWYKERFELPYLRDELMKMGLLVETLETATTWSHLLDLHSGILSAFQESFEELQVPGFAMAHVSHVYRTGASLYFTFMAEQLLGREEEEWRLIKNKVTDVIVARGGSLSHHHGIGLEHVKWMQQYWGPLGVRVLKSMKRELDPKGIMNPGKLVPSE
ncbi:MAG TPA: FAD-binding oxidoreductase [Candidatus Dormibacteraeota bacterium]|nr:FAD-binding oxidoreductase [Candidatus Dormibacteraeota bacterium]